MTSLREGSVLGHYRLIQRIGAGGMGEVYLAERQTDFNRRCAIKLIRPEMVTPDLIRRFTVERQTLAALNHPHIVHLIDGGTAPDGTPYLVTDFIEGIAIDQYCTLHKLGIAQRLAVFLEVCTTVHAAHQALVVHCDLKPGNILVTEQGEPMLLDFGVAKLLDPNAVGVTMQMSGDTRAGFTPQYASPEQILGLALTTSTDIYALGVILYELFTGRCPSDLSGSMADWIRSICERDADPPSTAVRKASSQPGSQGHKAALPNPLTIERLLQGDLDAIVMKALRKEPRDRYASADQFAEDLRRHLDGRPVLARQNTTQYVLRKLVARNKWGMAAAAVAFVSIGVGVGAALYQARIAARRFDDIRSLAHTFLFEVHDGIKDLAGATPARALIADTGTTYLDRLARDARGDHSLQREVAEGYLKVGDVQGNPYESNLGNTTKAIESYRKALVLAEAADSGDAASKKLLARVHREYALVLAFNSKQGEALAHTAKAIVLFKEALTLQPNNVEAKLDLASIYETLGDLEGGARAINLGKSDQAVTSYEQSLGLIPLLPSNHALAARADRARAVTLMKLGDMQAHSMKFTGAMTQYRAALPIAERLAAADSTNVHAQNLETVLWNKIAGTHMSLEQNAEAELAYQRALAVDEAALARDPNNARALSGVATTAANLGSLYYYNFRRFEDALRSYRRAMELFEIASKADPYNVVWEQDMSEAASYLSSILTELHRPVEARIEAVRALKIAKEIADRPGATHDQIYNFAWLGITIDPQDLRDGRTVLPYALRAVQLSEGKNAFDLHVLGKTYAALRDFVRAEETEAKAYAIFPPLQPGEPTSGPRGAVEDSLAAYRKALGKDGSRSK